MLQTSSLSSSLAATVECWTLRTAGGSNQWRRRRPRPAVICNQRLSYCLNSFSLSSILPWRGLALECFWCALRRTLRDQVAAATSRHIYTVSTLSPSRLGLDQAIWVRRGFALSLSPSINAEPKKRMWCVNCNHLTLFHPTSSSHTVWTLFHYWLSLDMVRYGVVISN